MKRSPRTSAHYRESVPGNRLTTSGAFSLRAAILLLGSVALCQQPQPDTYSLKLQSQIVVLDVVVNDSKGRPAKDLKQGDFKIYEDKIPQTVVSFEAFSDQASSQAPAAPIHSTAELDKLEPNAPVSIIVLDEVTTLFQDEAFARYSLQRYFNGQGDTLAQPTMLVAANLQQMMVLRDYTTSKKEIMEALQHHFASYNWQAQNGGWKAEQFDASFGSLMSIAEATAGHPGHKNLVWIGRGFPGFRWDRVDPAAVGDMQRLIATCANLLRDARVTLYSVDPAGVSAQPPAEDEDGFAMEDPFGGQVDFDSMARATGGQAFHGRNDVDHLIEKGVRDGETFYTISYKPSNPTQDPKAFRHIRVALADPSLIATTREGYYPDTAAIAPVKDPGGNISTRTTFDIGVAAQSLLVYDGLPLTIERDPTSTDRFKIHLKAAGLSWASVDEAKRRTELMVVIEGFDRKGKVLGQSAKMLDVSLPQVAGGGQDAALLSLPITFASQPGAARLRFVVRESASGKIGAENVFLVDPKTLADPVTGLNPGRKPR